MAGVTIDVNDSGSLCPRLDEAAGEVLPCRGKKQKLIDDCLVPHKNRGFGPCSAAESCPEPTD
jgi:hypothetical protein